jgi:hypothetical protein
MITNIIPSPYEGYDPSEHYSSMFRQSTISQTPIPLVLKAPCTRKTSRIIYYPSTLAEWCFSSVIANIIPSPYTDYVPSEHYSSVLRQSTISHTPIPLVLIALYTRKTSRIIYYPSTLAQWLFFISDKKY